MGKEIRMGKCKEIGKKDVKRYRIPKEQVKK